MSGIAAMYGSDGVNWRFRLFPHGFVCSCFFPLFHMYCL